MKKPIVAVALFALAANAALAIEGKWTPRQVLELDPAWLVQQGLQIAPSRLWDPATGSGLLSAAVNTGGCSGGFISSDGLLITNHHCLFSILQEHATPQNDIITNGFLARKREDELPGKSVHVTVPRRFTDVTKEILAAIPKAADDTARARATAKKEASLVAECEKRPATRCSVAAFDGGLQYVLIDTFEISDLRLVYAPPRSIGDFGGEVDNWMWPRHAGDFSIARAYVGGRPYEPPFYFSISTKGVQPGDFIMVMGYPGTTYRSYTAGEMVERRDYFFARRSAISREWIRLLENTTSRDPAGTIAVADNLKSLYNRAKNAEGQLAGFRRGSIVEKQKVLDEEVLAWAAIRPQYAGAVSAYRELQGLTTERLRSWDHDFLLGQIEATSDSPAPLGPKALVFATTVARSAVELAKPESERNELYAPRNIARVRDRMEREQKNFYSPADKAIFASFVLRALALPPDQRIAAIDAIFVSPAGATQQPDQTVVLTRIDELYQRTKLFDLDNRLGMLNETATQLRARHDPLVDIGFALESELRTYDARSERVQGAISRLRPEWRRAVIAHAGRPVAPDANSTLRISFAHVQGYSPRDAVVYTPQTSLAGLMEKNSGHDPFDAPQRILERAREKQFGQWADPKLGDVPVDFLADADTTGGNSGSPVVNGRGELVGLNFDRVWENVANDFGYKQDVNRNVNVDVRYLLWILDKVENAAELLKELGVSR